MRISEEFKKSISIVQLTSGDYIIGSIATIREGFILMAFPMNRQLNSMFMTEVDNQFFQIAHADYCIFKTVSIDYAEKYLKNLATFISKTEFDKYLREFEHILMVSKEEADQAEAQKVTLH